MRVSLLASVLGLLLFGVGAGCKGTAACENNSQCEDGFLCSQSGVCEAVGTQDADLSDAEASPACPTTTHSCVVGAPAGWSGPVIGASASAAQALPECPAEYNVAATVFEGLTEEGGCDCSCDATSAVTCGSARINDRGPPNFNFPCSFGCDLAGGLCTNVNLPASGACTLLPAGIGSESTLYARAGNVTSATACTGAATPNDSYEAKFIQQERYCATDVQYSCPESGACLPNLSNEDFGAQCIFQAGEHDCPAEYPAKETRFEGLTENHECSACSCEPPANGARCGGIVEVSNGTACSSPIIMSPTECRDNFLSSSSSSSARYIPGSTMACEAATVELTGGATETGLTTFCCTEAIADPL